MQEKLNGDLTKIMSALITVAPGSAAEAFTINMIDDNDEFEEFCSKMHDDKEYRKLFVSIQGAMHKCHQKDFKDKLIECSRP